MKKTLAIILCIIMVLALVACGSTNSSTDNAANSPVSETDGSAANVSASETNNSATGSASNNDWENFDWDSMDAVTLILGHTNAETDSRQTECLKFADLVKERSNGKINVDIYAGGQLGTAREMVEGLPMGLCDIVVEGYNCMSYFTEYGMDTLPYLYDSYEHFMNCWYNSDIGDMWISYGKEVGYTCFAPSYRGFRIVTSTIPFNNAEELKGLKIRTPTTEPFLSTWEALDTQATPMSLGEVLTGLQQGTIEAQENPIILSYNYGFPEVAKYIIKTNHSCGADIFMMDSNFFNSLPAAAQSLLQETAIECAKEISEYNYENEASYFDKCADLGCTIIEPDVQSFIDALNAANYYDNYSYMSDILDKIKEVGKTQ